jgi:hypothetical protein
LGLVLVLTISYIAPETIGVDAKLASGKYELITEEVGEKNTIRGPVYFEYSQKHNNPMESRIFKLHFVNPLVSDGPGFGFLIPLAGTEKMIDTGSYPVNEKGQGSTERFETVFGYADMGGKTTALYFSESGSISISVCTPREVLGEIDMVLNDGSGASIRVTGPFKAQPLPSNISL